MLRGVASPNETAFDENSNQSSPKIHSPVMGSRCAAGAGRVSQLFVCELSGEESDGLMAFGFRVLFRLKFKKSIARKRPWFSAAENGCRGENVSRRRG